jgi:hypothetical protein
MVGGSTWWLIGTPPVRYRDMATQVLGAVGRHGLEAAIAAEPAVDQLGGGAVLFKQRKSDGRWFDLVHYSGTPSMSDAASASGINSSAHQR